MNAEELLKRYAAEERDFANVDLSGANLRNADLSCDRQNRLNLRGANLSGATLYSSSLVDALLIGADLSETDLEATMFEGANLTDATLLDATPFSGVDGAILCNTTMPNGTVY